jgi:31-O-methyltransferase
MEPHVELARFPNGLDAWVTDRSGVNFLYDEIFAERSYLRPGIELTEQSVVFDIGANVGLASVFFAVECRVHSVYACEPVPESYEALRMNFAYHRIRGGTYRLGVSDAASVRSFTHYPQASAKSGLYPDVARDSAITRQYLRDSGFDGDDLDWMVARKFESEVLECEFVTLSDLLVTTGVDTVDLLKIDAERSELDVLRGISEADWRSGRIRQIVAEVHNDADQSWVGRALAAYGYQVEIAGEHVAPGSDARMVTARLA